jgi:hypothetical protein
MQFLVNWVGGIRVLFGEVEELVGRERRRVEGVPKGVKVSSEQSPPSFGVLSRVARSRWGREGRERGSARRTSL